MGWFQSYIGKQTEKHMWDRFLKSRFPFVKKGGEEGAALHP